uniref:hypothetical protein n=1 Tax=Candidatus Electronema sp. TaxID=2698783 RepID=UPI004056F327
MKKHIRLLPACLAAALPLLLLCSCVEKNKKSDAPPAQTAVAAEPTPQHRTVVEPSLLPNRFRQTGYMISEEKSGSAAGDSNAAAMDGLQLKVGVNISTNEPILLRDALKALAKTKNMSLSWASDVDQNLLIDIDIRSNDNFYEAIDNILRQLDYFHEVEGTTIVIKYRETKKYTVSLPYVRHYYNTYTGSTAGNMNTKDWENLHDQWETIKNNLDSLMSTWSTEVASDDKKDEAKKDDKGGAAEQEGTKPSEEAAGAARRVAKSTESSYTIDKTVGLVTVNAPKSLQKKVSEYLTSLEKEFHRQVVIDAKIIEVRLSESSSLGVDWNMLLSRLEFDGIGYGKQKSYGREDSTTQETRSGRNYTDTRTDEDLRTNRRDSVSEYGLEGSNRASSTSATASDSQTSLADGTKTRSSTGSTASGAESGEEFGASSFIGDRIEDSSSSSSGRTITDALSMGSSVATFIASGGGMAEAMATGATLRGFNFTSFIKALQEQGQTSVLSNPKISVLSGQHALISVGRDITYIKEIESKTTEGGGVAYTVKAGQILSGVSMSLSAVIKGDDEVVMNLIPMTSVIDEPMNERVLAQGNSIGLPVVNKREMNTWVRVKNGSLLVVGGLISETESKDGSHLPGTKDIPYLKYLFGYEQKNKIRRELIILLRPRIIN